MKPDISDWLRTVTEQVAFKPDRKAIEQELKAHYDDHVDALLELGYEPQEAEKQALEAMGDAEEVGRSLNRVHNYWLGLLWKLSQVLLAVCVLLLILTLAADFDRHDGLNLTLVERIQADLAYEEPPVWASRQEIPGGTIYLAASEDRTSTEDGRPCYHAALWLEGFPLYESQEYFFWYLTMEDQTGALPTSIYENDLTPANEEYAYVAHESQTGYTRQKFDVRLRLDHPPEYLILTQPYGEEPWSIRCDWEVAE